MCMGMGASMGQVLMCAGTKGKRTALKHSRVMMHQPSGSIGGQATDIEITVNEIKKLRKELYEITAFHTGKTTKQVEKDSDSDYLLIDMEAKGDGLVGGARLLDPHKGNKESWFGGVFA